jgi:hypothetical protein
MDQWRPLVLALYFHADTNSEADAATLYKVLDAIEKLNFRRLLVSENPNIFSNIFIEAVDDFELSPLDDTGLEDELDGAIIEYLIDQTRSEAASLFGDRFINLAIQAQDWNTRSAKLLFGRITHEHYRNSGGNLERTLDMSGIHIEHVLPQTPVTDSTEPVWLPKFFPPESTEEDLVEAVDRYLELEHRKRTESEADLKENEEKERAKIEEYIEQRFIDDLGNFLLLGEGDNIRASNRPLAQKLPQYYNHVDEFTSIYPNRYFTPEEGPIDRDELKDLRAQYEAKHDDATQRTKIDQTLKVGFNSLWTHVSMKDRRVELLLDILETLRFDALEDEFGMETTEEETREKVRELTDEVFENRTSLQSL